MADGDYENDVFFGYIGSQDDSAENESDDNDENEPAVDEVIPWDEFIGEHFKL